MRFLTFITKLLTLICIVAFIQEPVKNNHPDFQRHFDRYQVKGSFVIYNEKKDQLLYFNKAQYNKAYSPASTFKILNSLIGLETGVIRDQNFIIPWDSIKRSNPRWNNDHDLKSAFRNSTVWYYRELARRVGGQRMKYWLDKTGYGNADTSGGLDRFWLTGGLRVSPKDQIDFLKKLHHNKLPFSQRSIDIVKEIMIVKDSAGIVMRAKTGWADSKEMSTGWYVGYLQTPDNVYYFSTCIQTPDFEKAPARIEISNAILKDMGILR